VKYCVMFSLTVGTMNTGIFISKVLVDEDWCLLRRVYRYQRFRGTGERERERKLFYFIVHYRRSRIRFRIRSLDFFFSLSNLSSSTMALGSTQPVKEMSTRKLRGGKGLPARVTASSQYLSRSSRKCGSLDVSQTRGPPRPVTEIALTPPPLLAVATFVGAELCAGYECKTEITKLLNFVDGIRCVRVISQYDAFR
jgi:hypothetical protein